MTTEQQSNPQQAPALPEGFGRVGAAMLDGHENLASRRGITPEQLDGLFNFSYERYLNGDYETACQGFELLCLYEHGSAKYLQGYGYSLLALRNFHKAAICLYFSSMLMERGSRAWGEICLTAARLFAQAGEKEQALTVLQAVLEALPDSAEQEREQAITLTKALGGDK